MLSDHTDWRILSNLLLSSQRERGRVNLHSVWRKGSRDVRLTTIAYRHHIPSCTLLISTVISIQDELTNAPWSSTRSNSEEFSALRKKTFDRSMNTCPRITHCSMNICTISRVGFEWHVSITLFTSHSDKENRRTLFGISNILEFLCFSNQHNGNL